MTNRSKIGLTKAQRFARLAADTSGNMMLIMAAAFIPIAGMVGSAFDMGRAYMVKTRLQQACDAGALAGRRAMTTGTFDSAAEAQANHFFDSNFPEGTFGTNTVDFNPRGTTEGQVEADASVVVPMTIMRLFQKPSMTLEVECEAIYEIANTDIMFVLDITGSMNCEAGDSSCINNNNREHRNAKIKALRTAVVDFYDTLDDAIASEARLRIGFVPYSSTVHLGNVLPSSYISDVSDYQSRVANYKTKYYEGNDSSPSNSNETEYFSSSSRCSNWANNYGDNPVTSGTPPNNTTTTTYSRVSYSSSSDRCVRQKSVVTTSGYRLKGYKFTNWTYKPVENVDTSAFKTGSNVSVVTDISSSSMISVSDYKEEGIDMVALAKLSGVSGLSKSSYSWNGCLQERKTTAQASFSSIPSEAYDLNIDLVPSSKDTRWKPLWVQLIFNRNTGKDDDDYGVSDPETTGTNRDAWTNISCGKKAQKLEEMTHDGVYNYVNASDFKAIGSTYHDFGMIWGARLLSPTGIFKSENESAPNGKPISRHIVFLTDGQMDPDHGVYGMQGFERLDQRVTGGPADDGELTDRHNERFSAICEAIKEKNITIWVVAYATGLSTRLENCADPGRAFTAEDDDDLKEQFKLIAGKIAELRLDR